MAQAEADVPLRLRRPHLARGFEVQDQGASLGCTRSERQPGGRPILKRDIAFAMQDTPKCALQTFLAIHSFCELHCKNQA